MNKSNSGKRISKSGQGAERKAESGERKAYGSKPPYKKAESGKKAWGKEQSGERRAESGKKAWGKEQSGERRTESGERKAYGSKPAYKKAESMGHGAESKVRGAESGERKAYGSKSPYKKAETGKKAWGKEQSGERRAESGKKAWGMGHGAESKVRGAESGERKAYGSKPPYKKAERVERKTYGSKPAYKKAETGKKAWGKEQSGERRAESGKKVWGMGHGAERKVSGVESGERKAYGSKPAYKKTEGRGPKGDGFAVKKKAAYGSSKTFIERSAIKSITEREEKPARRSFGEKTDTGKGTFFTKKSEMKGYKPRIKEGEEEFKSSSPGARGKFIKTEASETFVPKIKSQSKERITENALYAGSEIRLNRYISNAGVSSRREADELIGAGLVTINGEVVTELGTKVKAGDVVKFNGQKLAVEAKVYILLNKPKDAITTSDDPDGRNTVMDLFEGKMKERIFPVGRLDRNTTGVLILTNDGELANRLTHPKYEINKVYKATLNKNLKSTDLWTLANGVMLEDGMIKPDAIAQSDAKEKNVVGIEIHSGRNRIIHRMFEHLGYSVDKLDRVLYAGLEKGTLKRGAWRELTDKELKALKRIVHLR